MSILLYPMIMIISYQLWWSVSNFVDLRFCITSHHQISISHCHTCCHLSSLISHWLIVEYRTGDIANDYWECRLSALIDHTARNWQWGARPIITIANEHWALRITGQFHWEWSWPLRMALIGTDNQSNNCNLWCWVSPCMAGDPLPPLPPLRIMEERISTHVSWCLSWEMENHGGSWAIIASDESAGEKIPLPLTRTIRMRTEHSWFPLLRYYESLIFDKFLKLQHKTASMRTVLLLSSLFPNPNF